MTPEDAARLTRVCFPDRPWTGQEFRAFLDTPSSRFLTRPGGFLLAQHIAPEAEIILLAVDPDHRRTGMARSLVRELISTAEAVFLDVSAGNAAARKLYEGLGFVESGRRAGYYAQADGTRSDAITMRWG